MDLTITNPTRNERLATLKRCTNIRHITLSPPPGKYAPDTPIKKIDKDSIEFAKKAGMLGGYAIFHDARIKPKVHEQLAQLNTEKRETGTATDPYWNMVKSDALGIGGKDEYACWSPHFHIVGIGYLKRADQFEQETRWIYKNPNWRGIPPIPEYDVEKVKYRDQVANTLAYCLSHAPVIEGRHSLRQFGYLHPKHIKRLGQEYAQLVHDNNCPVCQAAIVRYGWDQETNQPLAPLEDGQGNLRPTMSRVCGFRYEVRL